MALKKEDAYTSVWGRGGQERRNERPGQRAREARGAQGNGREDLNVALRTGFPSLFDVQAVEARPSTPRENEEASSS
jgi:hypothetical protein